MAGFSSEGGLYFPESDAILSLSLSFGVRRLPNGASIREEEVEEDDLVLSGVRGGRADVFDELTLFDCSHEDDTERIDLVLPGV